MTRKSNKHDIWNLWTAVLTLLGVFSNSYRDFPPLKIKPGTKECRAETLPLSYWSTLHTSDAKSTVQWFHISCESVCWSFFYPCSSIYCIIPQFKKRKCISIYHVFLSNMNNLYKAAYFQIINKKNHYHWLLRTIILNK